MKHRLAALFLTVALFCTLLAGCSPTPMCRGPAAARRLPVARTTAGTRRARIITTAEHRDKAPAKGLYGSLQCFLYYFRNHL